jgi:hypothetical protein
MFLQRARRNPLFLVIAGLVLIGALVFAWWTISPLFIRTTLNEGQNISVPSPPGSSNDTMVEATATPTTVPVVAEMTPTAAVAAATPTIATGAMVEEDTMSTPETEGMQDTEGMTEDGAMDAKPGETVEPAGPVVLAVGNFDRKDAVHYANGQAILAREADGSTILRLQDLDAANGPDLYVYVSEHPNPQSSEELHSNGHNLGSLKATNGSFSYPLDPTIDPGRIKSVVIYCRAFSVLFSTAMLQKP